MSASPVRSAASGGSARRAVTVLGKSPAWQDAGGACSGYLVEEGDIRVLMDFGNGVFGKLRAARDYTTVDAVVVSHMHADHCLDLVPFAYALTLRAAPAGRPVDAGRDERPRPPHAVRAGGARDDLRRIVGAWGGEELIEHAFEVEEYESGAVARRRRRCACASTTSRTTCTTTRSSSPRPTAAGASPTAPTTARPRSSSSSRDGTDLLMLEATLPAPEEHGPRGHITPARGGRARARAGARRLVVTHVSDELIDPAGPASEAEAGFGGPVGRRRGRRLRGLTCLRPTDLGTRQACPKSAICSRTSSGCAARSTSCSATSSAARTGAARRGGFSPARRRPLRRTTRRAPSSRPSSPASTPPTSSLEVEGRDLVLAGHRRPAEAEGRVYQQLEIEHGPFRRVDRARRRRRPRRRARQLPRRHPARRAAAGAARAAHAQRADRVAREDVARRDRRRRRRRGDPRGRRSSAAVPADAPVLPLRETVPFPDTLTPLAIGQERSVQLVNDVLAGDRTLVMVASRNPELEKPGPGRPLRRRRRRRRRADAPGARRHAAPARPGRPARAHRALDAEEPYLAAEIEEMPDDGRPSARADRAHAQRPVDVLARSSSRSRTCPRSCRSRSPTSTTRARSATSSPARCGIRPRRSRRSSRSPTSPSACAAWPRCSPASSRSSRSARRSSSRSSPSSTRPSASSSCASSSRRSRRSSASSTSRRPRPTSCASSSPALELPEEVRKQADRELAPAREPAAAGRRARRHPHVPRVDRVAAVGQDDRGQPRPRRTRARCSTRTTTASSRSRTASSSSSPCASSTRDAPGVDPLLRRPAGRRQDVARPLDRPRAGARVRAHQRRRRARRGRDPRPPAHLHRRDARRDHPRAARRRARATRCS